MKLNNTAVRLAMGGLAMGAGLVVARLLARGRGDLAQPAVEPPSPEQLIGTPQAQLSAAEAAESFGEDRERPH